MRRVFLFLTVSMALVAPVVHSQSLAERVDRQLPSLLSIYKGLHASPELSMQEEKSSALVAKELRAAGFDVVERFGSYNEPGTTCYGVVATMKNGSGPLLLIRSDMDALPVKEDTGLPYASVVHARNAAGDDVGVMHACGHDVHMSTLIGTARMLSQLRDRWHGTAVLIGQPAEEIVKGADAMLRAGLYEKFGKPAYAIALHDSAALPAGTIGYTPGYTMAASDSVDITVRGVGGHGASPEKTKDPVVIASQIVLALQTLVSRENSPLDPVVLTVGSIHGGTKRNVIPDEVKLLLTIRTYKAEVRKRMLASIDRVVRGITAAAGVPDDRAPIVTVLDESVPSTYNDPALSERLASALGKVLGGDRVKRIDPLMVSEDFSRYSLDHSVPAVLFSFGAVDPAVYDAAMKSGAQLPTLHSSRFAPTPEMTIRTGVTAMTTMALDLLGR
jgi:amidohydrolase